MGIYPDDFAEILKERAGEKYRPSNGTEGDIFMESFCFRCKKDINGDCPIVANTLFYSIDEPGYPPEWQYGTDGQPTCTAFEAKP